MNAAVKPSAIPMHPEIAAQLHAAKSPEAAPPESSPTDDFGSDAAPSRIMEQFAIDELTAFGLSPADIDSLTTRLKEVIAAIRFAIPGLGITCGRIGGEDDAIQRSELVPHEGTRLWNFARYVVCDLIERQRHPPTLAVLHECYARIGAAGAQRKASSAALAFLSVLALVCATKGDWEGVDLLREWIKDEKNPRLELLRMIVTRRAGQAATAERAQGHFLAKVSDTQLQAFMKHYSGPQRGLARAVADRFQLSPRHARRRLAGMKLKRTR